MLPMGIESTLCVRNILHFDNSMSIRKSRNCTNVLTNGCSMANVYHAKECVKRFICNVTCVLMYFSARTVAVKLIFFFGYWRFIICLRVLGFHSVYLLTLGPQPILASNVIAQCQCLSIIISECENKNADCFINPLDCFLFTFNQKNQTFNLKTLCIMIHIPWKALWHFL